MHGRLLLAYVTALALVGTGCASTTVIRSVPPGATVRSPLGALLGHTPYTHSDTSIAGTRQRFVLELEGYEPTEIVAQRDQWDNGRTVGFGIAGFFFGPLWLGLLWAPDYEQAYERRLQPVSPHQAPPRSRPQEPGPAPPPSPEEEYAPMVL